MLQKEKKNAHEVHFHKQKRVSCVVTSEAGGIQYNCVYCWNKL